LGGGDFEDGMALKVVVDMDKCLGYANCVADAPEVFEIPEEAMVVRVLQENPSEEMRSDVEAAALDCPARAITIVG
jgi:ferredoxin